MDDARALVAKTSLSRLLDSLPRPGYLRRNLRKALDYHERDFARQQTVNVPSGLDAPTDHDLLDRGRDWAFPLQAHHERVEYLLSGDAMPALHIKSLHLRLLSLSNHQVDRAASSSSRADPHWLPRRDERRLPCHITVAVYDLRATRRQIHMESVRGHIIIKAGIPNNGLLPDIEIQLREPFSVSVDQLEVDVTDGESWHRQLGDNYNLELGLHFLDSKDTAEILAQLEGRAKHNYSGTPSKEGIIKASWTQLPELPQSTELLPLKRIRGHKLLEMRYGIAADMFWSNRNSTLIRSNRAGQRQLRQMGEHLPTPVSEDMEPDSQVTIKYLFRQAWADRNIITTDLRCILCGRKREFPSFDRLRLHYVTNHSDVKFEVQEESDEQSKVIRMAIEAENMPGGPDFDFEWQKPKRTFSIKEHLEGISTWNPSIIWPKDNNKPAASKGRGRTAHNSPRPQLPPPMPPMPAPRPRETILPEEIPDLKPRTRRTHVVPRVKDVTFYRTMSKQKVEPGTEVSDSDDEINDFWLAQRQRQENAKLGVDETGQDFYESFNRHLDEEQPMSDLLTKDAVVRFTRKYAAKGSQPEWRRRFAATLDQLQTRHIIDKETVRYCKDLLDAHGQSANSPRADGEDEAQMEESSNTCSRSHLVNKRNVHQRGDDDVEMSTPKRRATPQSTRATSGTVPESPSVTQSSKHRMRWEKGRVDSQHHQTPAADVDSNERVFGRRTIVCSRLGEEEVTRIPISRLVKSTHFLKKATKEPTDLEWDRFVEILETDLGFALSDWIEFTNSDRGPTHIAKEEDWHRVLEWSQCNSVGAIHFRIGGSRRRKKGQKKDEEQHQPVKLKTCVCGERVMAMRKSIACGNFACARVFHMECVSLQKRSMDWRCVDCSS